MKSSGLFRIGVLLALLPALAGLLQVNDAFGGETAGSPSLITLPPSGGYSGMEIKYVRKEPVFEVATTGARYVFGEKGIELWRRIDPRTNREGERLVARLDFKKPLGRKTLARFDSQRVLVSCETAVFEFMADSLFTVTPAETPLLYEHVNLIQNPPWAKTGAEKTERMWTDGYGGSLHGVFSGSPGVTAYAGDTTGIELGGGDSMAHMVFPPRLYDFERLYGAGAKPFIHSISKPEQFEQVLGEADKFLKDGFGVLNVWNSFYRKVCVKGMSPECNTGEQYYPYPLEPSLSSWAPDEGLAGYDYLEPARMKDFIKRAHEKGFKVISYMFAPEFEPEKTPKGYRRIDRQSIGKTLRFMESFQKEYGLDGWYFDGGGISRKLGENYEFIKAVRGEVTNEGIIYQHDSRDAWSGDFSGLRGVMLDAWVDYTLVGEAGDIASVDAPDDPYLRYFTSGYGMSQAFGIHKRISTARAAVSIKELNRVMAQNLNSLERQRNADWLEFYKPFYDMRRREYLSGNFSPDVSWPPAWFRAASEVKISLKNPPSAEITWRTDIPTVGEVSFTSTKSWWKTGLKNWPDGPDGAVQSASPAAEHRVVLERLVPDTAYRFRIRCSNQKPLAEEIVWGYTGEFSTGE